MSVGPQSQSAETEVLIPENVNWNELQTDELEDYYNLGPPVKSHYGVVFVEPTHYEDTAIGRNIAPCIKKTTKLIYENSQAAMYYTLSLLIGILMSFFWALVFAGSSCILVWFFQPAIKAFFMWMRVWGLLIRASVRISCDPVCEAYSIIYSQISGKFKVNMSGLRNNNSMEMV